MNTFFEQTSGIRIVLGREKREGEREGEEGHKKTI